MPSDDFSGYNILEHGEQDNERLDETSLSFAAAWTAPGDVHEELDPTEFLRVENQGRRPSCVGHAVTTSAECAAGLASRRWDDVPQLSRLFSWQNGQRKWLGRIDPRQGCTIAHGVGAAISDGVCPETVAPYSMNGSALSGRAYNSAKSFRLQNQVGIDSADSARRFLEAGFGAIVCGVIWTRRMANGPRRLTARDVREDGSRGGHAVCLVGFRRSGEFLLANSWGERWGDDGVAELDPEALDYLCGRPYSVFRGVTDLTGFDRTRPFTSWGM